MKRIALATLMVLCCLGAVQASEKIDLSGVDKTWHENEPWWNPNPGNQILADVAEDEGTNNACPGQAVGCGNVVRPAALTAGDNDYYSFTANAGDRILVGTDADGTPTVDTFIHLYNADCSSQLASDDDSGPGLYSLLCFVAPSTGTYVLRVRGFSATGAGLYKAFISCGTSGNFGETCNDATAVPCGTVSLSGHTGCSVNDYTLPVANPCTGFTAAGRDQVLQVTVNANGFIDLVYTSSADASIYVVDACAPVNCLAGADATLSNQPEILQYTFLNAGTYYIILDSFGTNTSGSWTLTGVVDCGTVAAEPIQWTNMKTLFR